MPSRLDAITGWVRVSFPLDKENPRQVSATRGKLQRQGASRQAGGYVMAVVRRNPRPSDGSELGVARVLFPRVVGKFALQGRSKSHGAR